MEKLSLKNSMNNDYWYLLSVYPMPSSVPHATRRFLNFTLTTLYEVRVLLALSVRRESWGFPQCLTRSFGLQQVGGTECRLTRSAFEWLLFAIFLASYIISSSSRGHGLSQQAKSSLREQSSLLSSPYVSGLFSVPSFILSFHPQNHSMKSVVVSIPIFRMRNTDVQMK